MQFFLSVYKIYPFEFHKTHSRLKNWWNEWRRILDATCIAIHHDTMTRNKVTDRVAILCEQYTLLYARTFRGERRVVASVTKEILRNESDLCRAFYVIVRALDLWAASSIYHRGGLWRLMRTSYVGVRLHQLVCHMRLDWPFCPRRTKRAARYVALIASIKEWNYC